MVMFMKNFQCTLILILNLALSRLLIAQLSIHPSWNQIDSSLQSHQNQAEITQPGITFKEYYGIFYVGWGIPTGTVSDIAGLVEFPSLPAADIYKGGIALGFIGGKRMGGWLIEISMEGRIDIPLTELGQALANLSRTDNKNVSIEYISFDLFVGKSLMIGNFLSPYVGISNGLVLKLLSAGLGEEPLTDFGYGMAVKLGIDWLAISSWNLILRPGIRYQLLTLGVSIPHDLVFHLGVGVSVDF